MSQVFKLKEDYVIPAGTEFRTDNKFSFTSESEDGWASNMVTEGWQGVCMVVDTPWIKSQPELFEIIES